MLFFSVETHQDTEKVNALLVLFLKNQALTALKLNKWNEAIGEKDCDKEYYVHFNYLGRVMF